MPVGRPIQALEEKFWERVVLSRDTDCWEWSGYRRPDGYGVLRVKNSERADNIRAHLLAMELAGLGYEDEMLHHVCGNRACVNPDHLEPMSRSDHSSLHQGEVCQRGHLRSEHTYISPNGKRQCRACARVRQQGGD